MARIAFLLPGSGRQPIGGFRVVYEYANHLARRGHRVRVLHLSCGELPRSPVRAARQLWYYAKLKVNGQYRPRWLEVDPRVDLEWKLCLRDVDLVGREVVVATAWQTAEAMKRSKVNVPRRVYLVYDYEHWVDADPATQARMASTFEDHGVSIVATSPAVESYIRSCGRVADVVVPPGIDLDVFCCETGIDSPQRQAIGFPSRPEKHKGLKLVREVIPMIRQAMGSAKFWTFGRGQLPHADDVARLDKPSDHELASMLNRTAVFLLPSRSEGFGLPGLEAMACGAALVTTASGGIDAYARDGVNCIVVPLDSPKAMAAAVTRLMTDRDERNRLAREGLRTAKAFSLAASAMAFERHIDPCGGQMEFRPRLCQSELGQ